MGTLTSLPISRLRPALLLPLWLGSIRDESGNGNDSVVAGTASWYSVGGVSAIKFSSNGRLTVSLDSSLESTIYTVFVFGDFTSQGSEYVIHFSSGSNKGFNISTTSTQVAAEDGVSTRTLVASIVGKKSLTATLQSGSTPEFFLDGISAGVGSGSLTFSASEGDLSVGHSSTSFQNPIKSVVLYTSILTDDEILSLHSWFTNRFTPDKSSKKIWLVNAGMMSNKKSGLIGSWDCSEVVDGKVLDTSSSPTNGVISSAYEGCFPEGKALDFNSGNLNITGISSSSTSYTVEILVRPSSVGTYRYLLSTGALLVCALGGSSNLIGIYDDTSWRTFGSAAKANMLHHLVFVFDGSSSKVTCYLNGSQLGSLQSFVSRTFGSNTRLMSDTAGSSNYTNGSLYFVRVFDEVSTASEVKDMWTRVASRVLFDEDFSCTRTTLSNLGGVTHQSLVGDYYTSDSTGRWSVGEDSNGRYIECETAGAFYRKQDKAYGTWEFGLYKGGESTMPSVQITASETGSYGSGSNTGYYVRFESDEAIKLVRYNAKSSDLDLIESTSSYISLQTLYKCKVTRTWGDDFELFVDDVQVGSSANNSTYTTSTYLVVDLDAGDRFYFERQYLGSF